MLPKQETNSRPSFGWLKYVIAVIILLIVQLWIYPFARYHYHHTLTREEPDIPACINAPAPTITPLHSSLASRSIILDYGARVACYPKSGGIWIKHAVPVELDFLALSRENNTKRPWPPIMKFNYEKYIGDWPPIHTNSHTEIVYEEDVFCEKLRMLGADFWDLPTHRLKAGPAYIEAYLKPQIRSVLGFAWLDGGDQYHKTHGAWLVNLAIARAEHGAGLKGWNNVNSMDDRFRIAREIGALYCPDQGKLCLEIWCAQYPDYCDEGERVLWPTDFWYFGYG